jgi:hypothetical protein
MICQDEKKDHHYCHSNNNHQKDLSFSIVLGGSFLIENNIVQYVVDKGGDYAGDLGRRRGYSWWGDVYPSRVRACCHGDGHVGYQFCVVNARPSMVVKP